MCLLCHSNLQKERGEVHTIQLPGCCHGAHLDTNTTSNPGCLCNGSKKEENNQWGCKLLFKCKYLGEEAIEGKEFMKTPARHMELGLRLISHAFPSGIVPTSSPAKVGNVFPE